MGEGRSRGSERHQPVSLCGTAKGSPASTVNLTINDIPNWGPGSYTLQIDMVRTLSGNKFWFSDV